MIWQSSLELYDAALSRWRLQAKGQSRVSAWAGGSQVVVMIDAGLRHTRNSWRGSESTKGCCGGSELRRGCNLAYM